jgi:hypothetical protein
MIYNCFIAKNLSTLYFLNNMRSILSMIGICTLIACAAPKAPITKSVETKKKEAYKDVKISNKPINPSNVPKVYDNPVPVSPETPNNKPLDTREY